MSQEPRDVNRLAVVTGATGLVGQAIACVLAERWPALVLCGRDSVRLGDVARRVSKLGARAIPFRGDLTSDGEVERMVGEVRSAGGRVDLLVHSMGIYSSEELEQVSLVEFDTLFRTNVRAPFAVTQALLPLMRGRRGDVVFLNSGLELPPGGRVSVYAATKHALKAIADSLREEVSQHGLRVMTVALVRGNSPVDLAVQRMEGRSLAARRLARPEDIALTLVAALEAPPAAELTEIRIRPFYSAGLPASAGPSR